MNLLQTLSAEKIIAIVRGISPSAADQAADAMLSGGIRILEVTTNTEGASAMVSRWREKYAGQMHIGMGTVLNLDMAKEAVAAGSEFLISPNLDEAVVAYALEKGIDIWPGVMTPTEIVRAWNAGAKAVKVFPMGSLGLSYLKEIRAPLDHIPMIATGGVNLDNIGDFLRAGAIGVGLGSNLLDKALIREGRFEDLTQLAAKYVNAAKAVL
jgi:2-dehydro-3-deoxyphosphogluconate aldolase/(4S)-4-hydroxy-2-oxoglutarate aldolase